MSAANFQVYTRVFPDPTLNVGQQITFNRLEPSLSFAYGGPAISTLSDNTLSPGTEITGLLYTPDLDLDDPCYNATTPSYVPLNATRQANLPKPDYHLIALAPWISPACTLSYLQSATNDPVQAFLFYVPNNNTSVPPPEDNPQWSLGDKGQWKTHNYPVFAIPGPTGALLMRISSQYSGNLTSVPYGNILANAYDPRDYVRLFVDVAIAPSSRLPSLWVFLLIVLGILLGVVLATSIFMHCMQRRRRSALRQRVVNGEIDLEVLGIQRLTVPQHILDNLPLFEYGSEGDLEDEEDRQYSLKGKDGPPTSSATQTTLGNNRQSLASLPTRQTPRPYFRNLVNQPTCAICLEDFEVATEGCSGSTVRQLPCHHIFHPECVDSFLRENSSLCPMCKHSALPPGYCPRTITNAMVRRERIVQRMRDRAGAGEQNISSAGLSGRSPALRRIRNPFSRRTEPLFPNNYAMSGIAQQDGNFRSEHTTQVAEGTPSIRPEGVNRRDWARQRAQAMLGRQPLVAEHETENPSRWRKVLGGVFPGVA